MRVRLCKCTLAHTLHEFVFQGPGAKCDHTLCIDGHDHVHTSAMGLIKVDKAIALLDGGVVQRLLLAAPVHHNPTPHLTTQLLSHQATSTVSSIMDVLSTPFRSRLLF